MDEAIAIFRRSAYDDPQEVRLQVYQGDLQLYDAVTTGFITSLRLRDIDQLAKSGDEVTIHFRHSEDVKLILDEEHPLMEEIRKAEKRPLLSRTGKVIVFTGIVIAGILFLNFIFSSLVADIGLSIITPAYEEKLGQQMYHAAVPPVMMDGKRTALLQSFANKLKLSDTYNIQVSVLKSNELNAFAVPGGNIVIYAGLIDKMESYEELVALLGHEVSHINERHTTRAILKELSSKLFLIFLMDVSELGAILLLNADRLRGLSYSRALEKEADELGLKIMLENKVNVNGMMGLFERLQEADTLTTPAILNTHPLTEKRINYTKKNIKAANQSDAINDPELQRLWISIKTNKFPGEDLLPGENQENE